MKTKGLFDSLFIVIMILFLVPAVIIPNPAHNIIETRNYVNLVSLSLDEIIDGAIYEETNGIPHALDLPAGDPNFGNFCRVKGHGTYNLTLRNSLDDFFEETEKIYNVSCNYKLINIDGGTNPFFEGSQEGWFSGTINLTCNNKDNISEIFIEKNIDFNRSITASLPPATDFTFTFSPIPQEYNNSVLNIDDLMIYFPLRNNEIRYTTDGSEPNESSLVFAFEGHYTISGDVTIRAKAFNPGIFPYNLYHYPSNTGSATYTFVPAGGTAVLQYENIISDEFYHDGTCDEIIIVNN